jgi:hypothetical protein
MTRFLACSLFLGMAGLAGIAIIAACSGGPLQVTDEDGGPLRKDGAPVDPAEGGPFPDGGGGPLPSCEKYCSLVTANCTGDNAQYLSLQDCLAFCNHLPLGERSRDGDQKTTATIACRQYWADSPARTDPKAHCLAAGPFGANRCGDRCTAFCDVVLDACTSQAGAVTVYATQPDCTTACAGFTFRDAGTDGGGEGVYGPSRGDTLNCRLFYLRAAGVDASACAALKPSGPCQN